MKKIVLIAAPAALLAVAACGEKEPQVVNHNVTVTDERTDGPCGDGTFPAAGEACK